MTDITIAQEINLRQRKMLAVPALERFEKFHGPWCPAWREPGWSRRTQAVPEGGLQARNAGPDQTGGEFSREVGHAAEWKGQEDF